jgi:hypothetical protein
MIDPNTLYTIAAFADSDTDFGKGKLEVAVADAYKPWILAGKAEYLQWVADWKAQYAQLVQDSRKAKVARKQKLPTYDSGAATLVKNLKSQAKALLWLRRDAKRVSWGRKQLTKEAVA